jgi:hypothetical protein
MAVAFVGTVILLAAGIVVGLLVGTFEHDWHIGLIVGFAVAVCMIPGADWILMRTNWGRERSKGLDYPDLNSWK